MKQLALILLACSVMCGIADARTWQVPADAPTIQAGIDSAGWGDIVEVAAGVYGDCVHEASDPDHAGGGSRLVCAILKSGVRLRSETGLSDCVTIDAAGVGGVLFCVDVANVIVEGFTFRGGQSTGVWNGSGGGLYCSSSEITLRNCTFVQNSSPDHGGGLMAYVSPMTIDRCTFTQNRANTSGGGAFFHACQGVVIEKSSFVENSALADSYGDGGGAYFHSCQAEVRSCLIRSNEAPADGGGLVSDGGSSIVLSGGVVEGNRGMRGGGLCMTVRGGFLISNASIVGNTGSLGGGVFLEEPWGSPIQASNTDFSGNSAGDGQDGYIGTGASVLLTCCLTSAELWSGPGTFSLDNSSCGAIAVDEASWGKVKARYR